MGLLKRTGGAGFFVEDTGFFGALVSELDAETNSLVGAFRELAARAGQLRGAYSAGRIDAQEYGTAMANLRAVSSDQRVWTIGTTTGRWYVRSGDHPAGTTGGWQAATPPSETGLLVNMSGTEIGWATEDGGSLVPGATFSAYTGGDVAVRPVSSAVAAIEPTSIDSLFDTYVEEADTTEVVSGILAVDEMPGDDDWKRRYFELRSVAPEKPKRGRRSDTSDDTDADRDGASGDAATRSEADTAGTPPN